MRTTTQEGNGSASWGSPGSEAEGTSYRDPARGSHPPKESPRTGYLQNPYGFIYWSAANRSGSGVRGGVPDLPHYRDDPFEMLHPDDVPGVQFGAIH